MKIQTGVGILLAVIGSGWATERVKGADSQADGIFFSERFEDAGVLRMTVVKDNAEMKGSSNGASSPKHASANQLVIGPLPWASSGCSGIQGLHFDGHGGMQRGDVQPTGLW